MIYPSKAQLIKRQQMDSGFSLLEMLVSLSIFAALSLMGLIVLRSFTDGQSALQQADERISQIQLVSNIVRDDLANAVIRPARGTLGETAGYFDGGIRSAAFGADDAPMLRFVRGGHAASRFDTSLPNIQTLAYSFEGGNFIRRSYARPDATNETPVFGQNLLSDLDNMIIRFRVQGNWVDGLESVIGSRQSLPEFVELTFAFTNGENLTRIFAVGVSG